MNNSILSQAEVLLNKGNLRGALGLYQELIKNEPENAYAYQYASIIMGDLGDSREALDMSTKALKLNPSLVLPHVTMAYIYARLGDKKKSREEASLAFSKSPDLPEVLCCVGIFSLEDNELGDARKYLEKATSIKPSFYFAQYNLMAVYHAIKESKKVFQQTVTLFRLKKSVVNLLQLFYVGTRVYRFAYLPILLVSVLLTPVLGSKIILIATSLIAFVYLAGGIFIGFLSPGKKRKQFLINLIAATGTGFLGLFFYFLVNIFIDK